MGDANIAAMIQRVAFTLTSEAERAFLSEPHDQATDLSSYRRFRL
jgi:hypothetical protein